MADKHTMSRAEYRDLLAGEGKKKGHKFSAKPQWYNDRWYASKAEMERAAELDVLVEIGAIAFWIPQPIFLLPDGINKYAADFLVVTSDVLITPTGEHTVGVFASGCWAEEVKGRETTAFRKNVKLWQKHGKIPLHVLKRKRGGGWDTTVINPNPKEA